MCACGSVAARWVCALAAELGRLGPGTASGRDAGLEKQGSTHARLRPWGAAVVGEFRGILAGERGGAPL